MNRNQIIITGTGIVLTSLLGLSIIQARREVSRYGLTVKSTEGGNTDGNYPDGTYTFPEPTEVTVSATTQPNYVFEGWILDGEYQHSNLSITFQVTGNHFLVANFKLEGAPQLIPAYIRPVKNCNAEDWWYTWVENITGFFGKWLGHHLHLEHEFYLNGFIQFKIANEAGNGVSDQQIAVYTDPMPDLTDYGYLTLNGAEHPESDPLVLTSDSEGVVTANTRYEWREPGDHEQSLGYAGSIHVMCFPGISEHDVYPIRDGIKPAWPCSIRRYDKKRPNPIIGPVTNYVHAYWVDNPNLSVWGDCHVTSMVKMEGSKKYEI